LPVINLPKFKQEFHEHEKCYFALRDVFLNNYPTIVSNMAFKQGDMFTREEYPTVDQIRNKFTINLFVSEVPTNDYRCNIAQDIADDLKAHYERQAQGIIESVANESLERLAEVMESISHCCGADEYESSDGEIKTKKRKIYESTIEKARDIARHSKTLT
jgi:predicted house-cleaning noncanonical NTP pyrophosphatase (MazG superfamily)